MTVYPLVDMPIADQAISPGLVAHTKTYTNVIIKGAMR